MRYVTILKYGKRHSIIRQPPNLTLFSGPIECWIREDSLYVCYTVHIYTDVRHYGTSSSEPPLAQMCPHTNVRHYGASSSEPPPAQMCPHTDVRHYRTSSSEPPPAQMCPHTDVRQYGTSSSEPPPAQMCPHTDVRHYGTLSSESPPAKMCPHTNTTHPQHLPYILCRWKPTSHKHHTSAAPTVQTVQVKTYLFPDEQALAKCEGIWFVLLRYVHVLVYTIRNLPCDSHVIRTLREKYTQQRCFTHCITRTNTIKIEFYEGTTLRRLPNTNMAAFVYLF